MPRLVFTHAALADLTEIANYIENSSGSLASAERFTDGLVAQCEHLAAYLAHWVELLPDLRSTPHGNYVIFFRYVADTFEIVNILERHRDVTLIFKRDD